MRIEKQSRKHTAPNKGELQFGSHLKHVAFALRILLNTHTAGLTEFDVVQVQKDISRTYTQQHAHRNHSLSPWGHKCKLGGRGGRRNFNFGRHKLKLMGERGTLPLIKRGSW